MPMPLDRRAPTVEATAMRRRRASCADVGTPLSSVRAASGDGADEAQQRDEAIGGVTGEAFEERRRQTLVVDRRHERGASNLPERRCREALAPPRPPALDGAAVDADGLREAFHPGCRHAASTVPTSMAKPRRNDPCHCGSGNKYKKCCLAKDEAAERDSLVKAQAHQPTVAHRHERAAEHRLPVDE